MIFIEVLSIQATMGYNYIYFSLVQIVTSNLSRFVKRAGKFVRLAYNSTISML